MSSSVSRLANTQTSINPPSGSDETKKRKNLSANEAKVSTAATEILVPSLDQDNLEDSQQAQKRRDIRSATQNLDTDPSGIAVTIPMGSSTISIYEHQKP